MFRHLHVPSYLIRGELTPVPEAEWAQESVWKETKILRLWGFEPGFPDRPARCLVTVHTVHTVY